MIEVNGEQISQHEAETLVRMLCNDAKKIAGVFHGENRSAKFRVNWPDEYKFADANWKTFVEAVHQTYAERLGDPKTPPADARAMHLAIVLWKMIGKDQENDARLQLTPNTLQFHGDRYENRRIVRDFGMKPNLRALLLNSAATRH